MSINKQQFHIFDVPGIRACYIGTCYRCNEVTDIGEYIETNFMGFVEERKRDRPNVPDNTRKERETISSNGDPIVVVESAVTNQFSQPLCKRCLLQFVEEKYSEWFDGELEAANEEE